MGDGQFEGGGSVEWEINNKEDDGGGGAKKHKGKDKLPARGWPLGCSCVKVNGVCIVPPAPAPAPSPWSVTLADAESRSS